MTMEKNYTAATARISPRTRRKCSNGINTSSVAVTTAPSGNLSAETSGNGHTHVNKSDLDKLHVNDGYITVTSLKENENGDYIETTERAKAGYADEAYDLSNDSPVLKKFLSKLYDDTAQGLVTFAKGLVSEAAATFNAAVRILSNLFVSGNADVEGELTVGANSVPYEQGTQGFKVEASESGVRLQTDYLDVTKKLTAHEVEVQRVEHIGGKQISTGARMICSKVWAVPLTDSLVEAYYKDSDTYGWQMWKEDDTSTTSNLLAGDTDKFYFDLLTGSVYKYDGSAYTLTEWTGEVEYRCFFEKSDSDGRTVYQLFKAGDLAYCQTFNLSAGTTSDFANSYYWRLVTATGDDWIQLSDYKENPKSEEIAYNEDDTLKDGKVYGSTVPQAGDEIVLLGNVSDTGRQGAIIQASADTWSDGDIPYFSIYTGINSFVLPDAKIHFSPGKSWIKGTDISITSSGKEVDLQEYISGLSDGLTDVKDQIDESFRIYQSENPYLQTDGTYVAPTLSSEPASDWTTDEERASHVGDFYLSSDGFCWKFILDSGEYKWNLVVDKYLTEYVQRIGEKKRVFTSQPTNNSVYEAGDLWVNVTASGNDGNGEAYDYANDILVCIEAKTKGEEFDFSHWQPASNTKKELQSGLVTQDGFATLFSKQMKDNEVVTEATIGTAIEDGISKAQIKASQVEILSTNFSVVDGNVYANSLTLTGAFNNMRTEITQLDGTDGTVSVVVNNAPSTYSSSYSFDLLTSGNIISLQLEGSNKIALPFCYNSNNGLNGYTYCRTLTKFNGTADENGKVSAHNITIAEMRMLIGKKLYVYNDSEQTQAIILGRNVTSEADGVVVFEDNNEWIEDGISPGQYRIYECKVGCEEYNNVYYECIYWKNIGNAGSPLTEFKDNETA